MFTLRSPPLLPVLDRIPVGLRFGLGILLALAGWGGWGLQELVAGPPQGQALYLCFFPAVIAAIVLLGFWPSLACILTSALIIGIWIYEPVGALAISPVNAVTLTVFMATGVIIAGLGEAATWSWLREAGRQQQDRRYRALFDAIDEGFCIIEMIFDERGRPEDYRFLEINSAFERHSGLEDVVGKRMRELIPDHDEKWFRIYGEVATTGKAVRFEDEAAAMGRTFHVYAFRFGGPDDRQVAVVFSDITARKRAEEAQRRSEERYREIFQSIDEGFAIIEMIFDEKGNACDYRFVEANAAFERHTGLKDVIGRTARQLVPDLNDSWFRLYGEVARTGQASRFENQAPAMDGRWFDVYAQRTGNPEDRRVAMVFTDITARKRAELALRASEQRLEDVFDAAPAFMAVLRGPDLVFENANPAYLQLIGNRRGIIGKPLVEALPEVVGQPFIDILKRVMETGEAYRADAAQVLLAATPGGPLETKIVDFAYLPLREPDGTISGVMAHGVDLTERVRAEQQLRKSEERFRQLAELAPQLVWTAKADGVIDYYNSRASLYAGIEQRPDGTWSWEPVVHPDDAEATVAAWQEAVRSGQRYELEHRIRMTDGTFRWHLSRAEPVMEGDRVVRWFGTAADVHDVKQTHEVLRQSEERYRAVVEGQAEMISRFRRDGTLLFVNGAYARVRGTTPEALVGTNLWNYIIEQDRPEVEAMLDSLRPDSPEINIENRINTPQGPRWTLWRNRALNFDEHGRAVELQSAGIDITDRKDAEDALKRANADLLQFASAASHDLKEPLRGISRLASFISQDEKQLGEESRQRLDRIRMLCSRLTTMVSGLIEHARTGLEPQLEACDVNQVVQRIVDTSAEELSARACEVVVRGGLPVVHADRVLMERVFANLIANAVKFNDAPVKRVEFSWESDADGQGGGVIAVRDNGIGIDPKHKQAIFRIFRRIHAPEKYPGEGLGLALARKIIEAHRGTIDVDSAVGKGSTFRIRLPVITPGSDDDRQIVLVRPEDSSRGSPPPAVHVEGPRSERSGTMQ